MHLNNVQLWEIAKLVLADMQIDGNRSKEVVFEEIDSLLSQVQNERGKLIKSGLNFEHSLVS